MSDHVVLSHRFSIFWIGLLVTSLVIGPPTPGLVGQEPDEDADSEEPYEPVIDLRKVVYIPAASAKSKKRTLRFTFNVAADVPKGAKINFELQYNALPFDNTNYVLEGQKRRGVVFDWSPRKKLAVDEYHLRVRMHLADQTPVVRKAIGRKPRRFPKDHEPWPWLFFDMPVKVGTQAELVEQQNAICDLYAKYVDQLVGNYAEVMEMTDKVKAGEEAVNGASLDEKKFEKLIVAWRNKQGKLQQQIQDMVITHPVFATLSPTAYTHLNNLGRMVSKAGANSQKEVTTQYGVAEIRPKKVHRYFNSFYKWKIGKTQLEGTLEKIERLACAHLLPPEGAEGAEGAAAQGASKDGAKKDDPKAGGAKKSAKGTTKKKSSSKKN